MVREIVKDEDKLTKSLKRVDKTEGKLARDIIQDLIDTAEDFGAECLGLAANQIGYDKRIIVARTGRGGEFKAMVNPIIIKASTRKIETREGCLSLEGERTAQRHVAVTVMYMDKNLKLQKTDLSGMAAVIVQHEIDHTNGILI